MLSKHMQGRIDSFPEGQLEFPSKLSFDAPMLNMEHTLYSTEGRSTGFEEARSRVERESLLDSLGYFREPAALKTAAAHHRLAGDLATYARQISKLGPQGYNTPVLQKLLTGPRAQVTAPIIAASLLKGESTLDHLLSSGLFLSSADEAQNLRVLSTFSKSLALNRNEGRLFLLPENYITGLQNIISELLLLMDRPFGGRNVALTILNQLSFLEELHPTFIKEKICSKVLPVFLRIGVLLRTTALQSETELQKAYKEAEARDEKPLAKEIKTQWNALLVLKESFVSAALLIYTFSSAQEFEGWLLPHFGRLLNNPKQEQFIKELLMTRFCYNAREVLHIKTKFAPPAPRAPSASPFSTPDPRSPGSSPAFASPRHANAPSDSSSHPQAAPAASPPPPAASSAMTRPMPVYQLVSFSAGRAPQPQTASIFHPHSAQRSPPTTLQRSFSFTRS